MRTQEELVARPAEEPPVPGPVAAREACLPHHAGEVPVVPAVAAAAHEPVPRHRDVATRRGTGGYEPGAGRRQGPCRLRGCEPAQESGCEAEEPQGRVARYRHGYPA